MLCKFQVHLTLRKDTATDVAVLDKNIRKKTNELMEYSTKFICDFFLWMGVTFRGESNDDN